MVFLELRRHSRVTALRPLAGPEPGSGQRATAGVCGDGRAAVTYGVFTPRVLEAAWWEGVLVGQAQVSGLGVDLRGGGPTTPVSLLPTQHIPNTS